MSEVLILGAGASFGHGAGSLRPPLARGFFSEAARRVVKSDYSALRNYLNTETAFSEQIESGEVDIEALFGAIEGLWSLCPLRWGQRVRRYGKQLALISPPEFLRSYITEAVFESTAWLSTKRCDHHDELVQRYAQPGNSIISFNYDLIVDASLRARGDWNEARGYGFTSSACLEELDGAPDCSVQLLKPHGSMNWFSRRQLPTPIESGDSERSLQRDKIDVLPIADSIEGHSNERRASRAVVGVASQLSELYDSILPESETDEYERDLKMSLLVSQLDERNALVRFGYLPCLIMPTKYKPLGEMGSGDLRKVWRATREAIESAERLTVVGFSFRDDHFNQVMAEALSGNGKSSRLEYVVGCEAEAEAIRSRLEWMPVEAVCVGANGLKDFVKGF